MKTTYIIDTKYAFYNTTAFPYINDVEDCGYYLIRKLHLRKDMEKTKDLLHGNITRELIALMLPLIIGNILQQFYNTIDSIIVGRYVGSIAFAAVGVAGSVMNLFIFMLNGGCNGIAVVFAELYGQKSWRLLKRESFLSLLLGEGFTAVLSMLSLLFLSIILNAIKTPAEVFTYARDYLWIILLGLPVTFLYNWCAAALQAAGDTRTPLYTLMTAMCINTVLDLFFVIKMQMGTAGTAAATVIAQLIASLICIAVMRDKHPEFFFGREDLVMDKGLMKKTAKYGTVSSLHQSSLYIGKLLVQGAVNTGGTDMISAYTATMRIEGFANSFSDSGAVAMSVFTAQNHGAGLKERVRAGLGQGMTVMLIIAVILSAMMIITTNKAVILLMGSPSAEVLKNAGQYMTVISIFYFLCFIGSSFVGHFRGIGRVEVPVIGTIIQISIRVVLSYMLINTMGLKAVALATGIGWAVIVIYQTLTYRAAAADF